MRQLLRELILQVPTTEEEYCSLDDVTILSQHMRMSYSHAVYLPTWDYMSIIAQYF